MNQPPLTEEEIAELSMEDQILHRMHKPESLQNLLIQLRAELLVARGYEKLAFTPEKMMEAAAAHAYSLSKVHFVDRLIQFGTVIPE